MKIKSKDKKMWSKLEKKPYGYFVLSGRTRDGKNHGHFEIHVPGNKLGAKHPRGFIKKIRRENKILFSGKSGKKTRTIRIKINDQGEVIEFSFIGS